MLKISSIDSYALVTFQNVFCPQPYYSLQVMEANFFKITTNVNYVTDHQQLQEDLQLLNTCSIDSNILFNSCEILHSRVLSLTYLATVMQHLKYSCTTVLLAVTH